MEGQEIEKERKRKERNAERNKKYRDKDREIINLRRREKRIKEKAVITPKPIYECEKTLKGVDKLPEQKVIDGKAENTKQTYISFIRQFIYSL